MLQLATTIDLDDLHALLAANGMRFGMNGLRRILDSPGMQCVGVQSHLRLVGAAVFRIEAKCASLYSVDVYEQFRGQGLGRKLINAVATSAQRQGRYHVMASLNDPDGPAAGFLQKTGFKGGTGFASECCGLRFFFRRSVADDVLDSIMTGQGRTVR